MAPSHAAGLNLHVVVPATVDASCSCFCWKQKEEPVTPVIIHQNSLVASRKARMQQQAEAVEAVYNEVIRRTHPDFSRATEILNNVGLNIQQQPKFLTVEQVQAIHAQLQTPTAASPSVAEGSSSD